MKVLRFPRALILPVLAFLIFACQGDATRSKRLAELHCGSCHAFPDPALLDKQTWRDGVLPEMAFRMGLDLSKLYETPEQELAILAAALPNGPLVSEEQWQLIKEYYIHNAPDTLLLTEAPPASELERFRAEPITLRIQSNTMLSMVEANPERGEIFVGTRTGYLYKLNQRFVPTDSVFVGSAPSDIVPNEEHTLVTAMGIMDPNDRPAGAILSVAGTHIQVLHDSLKRPVDIQAADLDRDGNEELIVSSFGNFTGSLDVLKKINKTYRQTRIHHLPGTRQTVVRDFNDDGLPDILALITQGDEQLTLFTNRGKLEFSPRVVLRFPPVHGSSYFELADFNGDGHDDILYANGDNADYSPALKPYHGIRIFLNDGRLQFREWLFFPMYGASKAIARDFDNDGDLDIAAISFFPDFDRTPERGFIYLENNGNGEFNASTTPLARTARWLVMDATDIDCDDDLDVIIGSLGFTAGVTPALSSEWVQNPVSLLVLRNLTL